MEGLSLTLLMPNRYCRLLPGEYAEGIRARLRAAAPGAVIHDSFLGPSALAGIFAATRLNMHPCLYDAFCMTIVEAASQGEARTRSADISMHGVLYTIPGNNCQQELSCSFCFAFHGRAMACGC